jgi:hypothetical protein
LAILPHSLTFGGGLLLVSRNVAAHRRNRAAIERGLFPAQ